ncbi:unnamed protein product [Caenorhabditis brenneri]
MSRTDIETWLRFIQLLAIFAIYELMCSAIYFEAWENFEILEIALYFSRYGELTNKMIEPMLTSTTLLVDYFIFMIVGPWILYRINRKTIKTAFLASLVILPFILEYGFPTSTFLYWWYNPHAPTRNVLDFLVGPKLDLTRTAKTCSFFLIFAFLAAVPPVLICFPHVIYSWCSLHLQRMHRNLPSS